MSQAKNLQNMVARGRTKARPAEAGDPDLGPLALLPGKWANEPGLLGGGWNMISLPFAPSAGPLDYRLLLNRYNETLHFDLVDKAVPNRGIERGNALTQTDQFVVTLDYEQAIEQIAAADFPESGPAGPKGLAIHREPGLWLHAKNQESDRLDVARLSTIPHGDSVLALGSSRIIEGPPVIPAINGLVEGATTDLEHFYLSPYKHFRDNPFQGTFNPLKPHQVLEAANQGVEIVRTTELEVDTTLGTGAIANVPFVKRQAAATRMKATFWIQELADEAADGRPKLRLQYLQVVMLDFFPRRDGVPGLMSWPHVSANTLLRL